MQSAHDSKFQHLVLLRPVSIATGNIIQDLYVCHWVLGAVREIRDKPIPKILLYESKLNYESFNYALQTLGELSLSVSLRTFWSLSYWNMHNLDKGY